MIIYRRLKAKIDQFHHPIHQHITTPQVSQTLDPPLHITTTPQVSQTFDPPLHITTTPQVSQTLDPLLRITTTPHFSRTPDPPLTLRLKEQSLLPISCHMKSHMKSHMTHWLSDKRGLPLSPEDRQHPSASFRRLNQLEYSNRHQLLLCMIMWQVGLCRGYWGNLTGGGGGGY